MPSFGSPKKQAERALRRNLRLGQTRHGQCHDGKIHSLGTARNYKQALINLTTWIQKNRLGDLKNLSVKTASRYLEERSQAVGQKTLDQERQAIQLHLGINLPVIKSELTQTLKSRAYTLVQTKLITSAQTQKYKLSTQIALAAGLRAHELLTLRRQEERSVSTHRIWSKLRFTGREGQLYTVEGKGGLVRTVLIPTHLAIQLEQQRLTTPTITKDRTIKYTQYYAIGGGQYWSNSFSAASKRELGWSHGAHGLRHTYAQTRMDELQGQGFLYEEALKTVSQEMGHFRPEITEVYLR